MKRTPNKRSEMSKARNKEYLRKRRSEMTEDEKAVARAKDRDRKRQKKSNEASSSSVNDSMQDSDFDDSESSSRLTDRTYFESKERKFKNDLKRYGVTNGIGLFGKKLYDIKWHACTKCKTKQLGVRFNCYCKKKYILNSDLIQICPVPEILQKLSLVEELLISIVHPVIRIYRLRGGQYSYGGHVINFFQDLPTFASRLPHALPDLNDVVSVCCESSTFHKDFKIRKQLVLEALQYLVANNKYYSHIQIDMDNVHCLPDDGFYSNETELKIPQDEENEIDPDHDDHLVSSAIPNCQAISPEMKLKHNLKWPKIAETPINELHSPGFIAKAFPRLFPDGKGDLFDVQSKNLTARVYFQYLMDFEDGRFSSHCIFPYFAMNSVMRWECCTKGTVYMKQHPELRGLNIGLIKEMMDSGRSIGNDLMVYSSNIRSSRDYWLSRSSELQSMVKQLGLPSFFFTLSAADFHWPRLYDLLMEHVQKESATEKERHKIMLDNPKVCSDYFFEAVEIFLNDILFVHFKVKDYWYRFEWQLRGSPHLHGILYVLHPIDVRELRNCFDAVKDNVIKYFEQHISCNNPNTNYVDVGDHPSRVRIEDVVNHDDDLAALVNSVQRHTKHSKKTCLRFDKKKNAWLCKHHFPKPLRETSDIVVNQRGYFEYEGSRNDPWLNKFCEFIVRSWRANHDLTAILSEAGFVYYIAKYASKPETKSSELLEVFKSILEKKQEDGKLISAIRSAFMTCLVQRDYSGQEVHHILSGKKLVSCSRSFVKLNLKVTEWLYHVPLSDFATQHFSDNCNEVLKKYSARPEKLESVSLLVFSEKFNIYTYNPRSRKAIVQVFPRHKISEDKAITDDIAKQLLMLYIPWRTLNDFPNVSEDCISLLQSRNLSIDMLPYYNERLSVNIELSDDETENESTEESCKDREEWMNILDPECETEACPESELGSREIDLNFEWTSNRCSEDEAILWSTFIENSKQSFVVVKDKLPSSFILSCEQQKLLDVVKEHTNFIELDQSRNHLPRFILCQGRAGCGKSTVIMAIVDFVSEKLGSGAVLILGPTGASAVTVQGRTIHSALHLQIGKAQLEDLKGETLHRTQNELKEVVFVIIDEFSMVGCKMLHIINKRLMQIKCSPELFGSCVVLMFGDVKQLSPVGDIPMYRENVAKTKKDYYEGSLIYKCVDCVKVFNNCHRQVDAQFLNFLENVSNGLITEDGISYISDRFESNMCQNERKRFQSSVHLYQTREKVHLHNEAKLLEMNLPVLKIPSENNNRFSAAASDDIAMNLAKDLYLCIGARVMLRCNLWTEGGLMNGSIGIVTDIVFPHGRESDVPEFVLVHFDGYKGPVLENGSVPITRITRSFYIAETYCTRVQFPLILAYAVTYYKCQSLTLPMVVAHVEEKEKSAGVFYVGMSRVKAKKDLQIVGPYPNSPLFQMNKTMYDEKIKAATLLVDKAHKSNI